ncbi:MAG: universal stress protein [Propionibacteriaceae bacterium]
MSVVLVGYVPSAEGRAALAAGIDEARRRGIGLMVLNTTRGDALVDSRFVQGTGVDDLRAELAGLDIPAELRQVNSGGDVADELDELADEVDAELIVIGLRRRSPVGKLILGSAASRILLTVGRPVLTVKA